jgi:tRNA threonylcarbamoyladenosine biosynthesis protein TsaB
VKPRILAIDTTTEHGSLALVEDAVLIEEVALHSPTGFGHVLYPEIEKLLASRGWRLDELDCIAGAAGPGSFTGIRVGLAAVKGLAVALDRPAVAVSNLQAIAWHGRRPLRASLMDARRGEIYGAVYSSSLELVQSETVTRLTAWLETLPEGELEILSPSLDTFSDALSEGRFARLPKVTVPRAMAGAIGRIAARQLAAGAVSEPAAIDANYVRRSDAELLWKEW